MLAQPFPGQILSVVGIHTWCIIYQMDESSGRIGRFRYKLTQLINCLISRSWLKVGIIGPHLVVVLWGGLFTLIHWLVGWGEIINDLIGAAIIPFTP